MSLATLFANGRTQNNIGNVDRRRRRRIPRLGRGPSAAASVESSASSQLGGTTATTTRQSELGRELHQTTCTSLLAAIQPVIDDDASSVIHGINNGKNKNTHEDEDEGSNNSGVFRFDFAIGSMTNSNNGIHNTVDDFAVGFDVSKELRTLQREGGTKSKKKKKRKKKGKQIAGENTSDNTNSENVGTMLPSQEQHRPTNNDRSPTRNRDNDDRDGNCHASPDKKTTKRTFIKNAPDTTFVANAHPGMPSDHSTYDSTKTPSKCRIKSPPGFHFDPVVRRKGALVNRQSMGLHRQNRSNLPQQHGGVNNTKEGNSNSQQDATDAVTNSFTFGFNILGHGLLLSPSV
ncbi:hypothetical protein ACHAW5_007895 [Stephanodiscus triporus]|uniref:Uncharacterized protein n=1 Tax=Stephanodiscus triporus TaxID=2934178 RepID=A0ABD3MI72_9STRA